MKEASEVKKVKGGGNENKFDKEMLNDLSLRLEEIRSFLQVVHGALDSKNHDTSFYTEHVERIMWLLEERFDGLNTMVKKMCDHAWKYDHNATVAASVARAGLLDQMFHFMGELPEDLESPRSEKRIADSVRRFMKTFPYPAGCKEATAKAGQA